MRANYSIRLLSLLGSPDSLLLPFTRNMSSSSNILFNAKASTYTIPSHITPPAPEIKDFHTTLSGYAPTPLLSLPSIASKLGISKLLIKDERLRFSLPSFKPLGISWAIRNALIAELSESSTSLVPSTISLPDLASKVSEAQIKLVTATDGKLSKIVAKLGKDFGVKSIDTRIFVERELDEEVKEGIRVEGAEVIGIDGEMEVVIREAWLHAVAVDGVFVGIDAEENYEDFPKMADS
jgi:diaminopropionate ammonia-lyase